MTQRSGNRWVPFGVGNPAASLRLFCFAYAGGGASVFQRWNRQLPPEIALCAVQLPGRETRLMEPCIRDLNVLTAALDQAITPLLDRAFAFFGYSLGARVAYALAHRFRRSGRPRPVHLTVAAHADPLTPPHRPGIAGQPDADFCAHLRSLGGTTDVVLQEKDLLDLLMPALRADFALLDQPVEIAPLDCPITACGSLDDPVVDIGALHRWGDYGRGPFRLRLFPGGHFFIQDRATDLVRAVAGDVLAAARRQGA